MEVHRRCPLPSSDVTLTLCSFTYLKPSVKNHPKKYVIMTSLRSEVSSAPSNNVNRMSSVGVVETYIIYGKVFGKRNLLAIFPVMKY